MYQTDNQSTKIVITQLEIALKEANEQSVSLASMSPDALESFMIVMSSLKSIAISIVKESELTFSITEGSAACAVEAPTHSIQSIHKEIDLAITGESDNEDVTINLRKIQKQIKRKDVDYRFVYKNEKNTIDIHTPLSNAKKISLRRNRLPYVYKLKVVGGFLNEIGGKNPNYHFDYGGGEKITIECTKENAQSINRFLYKKMESLLLCKEWEESNKKNEYTHVAVIEDDLIIHFRAYLDDYNKENELVKKLTLTYNFVDKIFEEQSNKENKVLNFLLIAFNNKNFHLSELKTLLVISKPFKEHETIKEVRAALLETYQKKKINA